MKMKRQDLDDLLKPFGIYVKTPSEKTNFYELWSEDGCWKIALQGYMSWLSIEWLVDRLCCSTHIVFIEMEDGLVKYQSKVEDGLVEHQSTKKCIANPFCGCKSLDEMKIAKDLAGW